MVPHDGRVPPRLRHITDLISFSAFPVHWALGIAIGVQVADFVTTIVALSTGAFYERNPIAVFAIDAFGLITGLFLLTVLSLSLLVFGIELSTRAISKQNVQTETIRLYGYLTFAVFLGMVTTHNVFLLFFS